FTFQQKAEEIVRYGYAGLGGRKRAFVYPYTDLLRRYGAVFAGKKVGWYRKQIAHYYFRSSSIFRLLSILPFASNIRMSLASCRNSEAKMKSFSSLFLLKMISLLLPSHSFTPWYIYMIWSPISITLFMSCVFTTVVILYSSVISLMSL